MLRPLGSHVASYCCRGRDVISNARQHVGHRHTLVTDIKSAFPSTTSRKVQHALAKHGVPAPLASLLTRLCTFQNQLPQGAPTSPALLDLVLRPFDDRLTNACLGHGGVIYTRYVDDVCVSANRPVKFMLREIRDQLGRLGYQLARGKTRYWNPGQRATVAGIVLSKEPSLDLEFRDRIRRLARAVAGGKVVLTGREERALRGRIAWIGRLHVEEAAQLLDLLRRP